MTVPLPLPESERETVGLCDMVTETVMLVESVFVPLAVELPLSVPLPLGEPLEEPLLLSRAERLMLTVTVPVGEYVRVLVTLPV